MNLPKGGGAISGIGEKFAANPVTGTGSMSVPIFASPGRAGFGPQLSLSYDSGSGNGPFGFGWGMAVPAITRKTDKGLPRYGDGGIEDSFILAGAEDLVPFGQLDAGQWIEETQERLRFGKTYSVRRFRPRTEGLFSRIEQWVNATDATDIAWRTISKENASSWFGIDPQSRISDPENPTRIFSWLISLSHDDKGNVVSYGYVTDNEADISTALVCEKNRTAANRSSQKYLKRIKYGNRSPYFPDFLSSAAIDLPADWCFELVFDFGDHGSVSPVADTGWLSRSDAFSNYKAGFEVRTSRLCQRVLMFHHFPDVAGIGQDCLVHSTDFEYSEPDDDVGAGFTHLMSVSQVGYRRSSAGYASSATPPIEFEYSLATIDQSVHEVDERSIENLPRGIDGSHYQWIDLHGEGLPGILAEQAGNWLYKRNLSPAPQLADATPEQVHFGSLVLEKSKPVTGTLSGGQQLLDLDGDGQLDLVNFSGNTPGYFERERNGHWSHFSAFVELPVTDWSSQELKFIDLTGNGHADILISEDDVFCWHESKGKGGFGAAHRVTKVLDEEVGPRIAFSNSSQMISLADMSGDGLSDIVRIRNGNVCYWPNLGYGRFGSKVTMDAAPLFDNGDIFDIRRLRLADVDGSGTTDIIYFSSRGAALYFNRSGNQWSGAQFIEQFPIVNSAASAMIADLKGNGTACLIWSSALDSGQNQLKYIDLMGGQKPHLLVKMANNLGAETQIQYAPSTRFYLEDEFAERPWITRLPFPVHVVERVETHDLISRNRFVTRYAYHHGYFDGTEREFRGFGMVEQWDTEEVASLSTGTHPGAGNEAEQSNIPTILTKTWFHTGAWFDHGHITNYFAGLLTPTDAGEYYRPPGLTQEQARALLLPDTVLPFDWDAEEQRQACRVLKGSMLRQEVYALDGSAKEPHPYSVAEQNFTVERLQPVYGKQKGVYLAHPRETLTYHYERAPEDPRIEHGLTLDVDAFGNVRQALAIKYGRLSPDLSLAPDDQAHQTRSVGLYTESDFTNAVDESDSYRAPVGCDNRTYELTGLNLVGRTTFAEWTENSFAKIGLFPETPYELPVADNFPAKRLIERVCTIFRADNLAADLPLGVVEARGIPAQAYKLALTQGLVESVFQRGLNGNPEQPLMDDIAGNLGGSGADQGGYVDLFADQHWWIPSGRSYFSATTALELSSAKAGFFLPAMFVSPFAAASTVTYDTDALFPTSMTDALGNISSVEMDYRVLQPRQMTDPNGNRSQAVFDIMGLVAGMAVQGKEGEGFGDSLDGFNADLTEAELDAFFASTNPRNDAAALLGQATMRVISDESRFYRSRLANPDDPALWQPAYAATLTRETHVSALDAGAVSPVQLAFGYSDGFGREIQKKIQAEDGPLTPVAVSVSPRWVGSGWTIFNNKGKPVRQYEPFFTATHKFEFARAEG